MEVSAEERTRSLPLIQSRSSDGLNSDSAAAIPSQVISSLVMLMLIAPVLVRFALEFGPSEYFALMVLLSHSRMFLGLGIAMIGIDLQTGQARFTFGIPQLLGGIDVSVFDLGLIFVLGVLFHA